MTRTDLGSSTLDETLSEIAAHQESPTPSQQQNDMLMAKVLIVDDEPINVKIVQKYLSLEGYTHFITTTDAREAVGLVAAEEPDIVLLDIMMPYVSGLEILETLRADRRFVHLPILILTAASDQHTRKRALDLGASDFLGKPLDPTELVPRVRNMLTVKQHYDYLQVYTQQLEDQVLERTAQLAKSRQQVIHCLARAAEFPHEDAGRHVCRVGQYARLIAEELGWTRERLEVLEQAAQLHDVGKIAIPDSVLRKAVAISDDELEVLQRYSGGEMDMGDVVTAGDSELLRRHPELGASLLDTTDSPILEVAATIALSHHEKWDGSGYPLGLAGEEIPIEGRITAVADVFDTLSCARQHRPMFPVDKCFAILEEGRGRHFDPEVLDAFFAQRDAIVAMCTTCTDAE